MCVVDCCSAASLVVGADLLPAVVPELRGGHLVGAVPGVDLGIDSFDRGQIAAAEDGFEAVSALLLVILQYRPIWRQIGNTRSTMVSCTCSTKTRSARSWPRKSCA